MREDAFVVAITPDDRFVLCGLLSGPLRLLDMRDGRQVASVAHGDGVRGIAAGPRGELMDDALRGRLQELRQVVEGVE